MTAILVLGAMLVIAALVLAFVDKRVQHGPAIMTLFTAAGKNDHRTGAASKW